MLRFCCFLCFNLYEFCLLDFSEHLISFWYILACTRTISIFFNISLLSHAWHYFARVVTIVATCFTHMHSFPFYETCTCCLHEWSFTLVFTHLTMHSDFSCFQSPVRRTGLPWPRLCLAQLALHIFESEGFSFPLEIAQFCPGTKF